MAGIMLPQRSVLNVGHALDIRTAPDDRCDLTILQHRERGGGKRFNVAPSGQPTDTGGHRVRHTSNAMFQKRPPPPHEILVRKGGVPQEVITALKESGVPVRVWPEDPRDQLLDVDFVVGKSAAITLLTESDVTAMDRDLLRMRFTAVKGYSRPLVLVWKSVTCADGYLRAQTLASTEFRVAVVPVSSATEAARFTKTMHDQEQRNTPNNTWKSLTDPRESNTQVLAALTEVPGLGKKRAEKLLQRFPSLKLIANADQQALADWIGGGPGRAVYAYFHS